MNRKTAFAIVLTMAILTSSFPAATGAPPNYHLYTKGTDIVDAAGIPIYLIGATLSHNEWSKGYFDTADIDRLKAHGCNIVEIHQARLGRIKPTRDSVDETYLTLIDRVAAACEVAKIYYIINIEDLCYTEWDSGMPSWMLDNHNYGSAPYAEATVNEACLDFWDLDNPLHNDNRAALVDLWVYLAQRYNKPHALYGIMNEPISHITLGSGSESSPNIGISYSTFMTQMIDAIQAVSDNLILIDKPYLWYLDEVQPINRNGIVWEDHYYVDPPGGENEINTWKAYIDASRNKFMSTFGKPLCIGEFGPYPANMEGWPTILQTQVAHIDKTVAVRNWHTWSFLNGESNECFSYEESEQLLNILFPRVRRSRR